MIRTIVVAIGILLLAVAVWNAVAIPRAWPASLWPAFFGVMILASIFFERRYRSERKNGKTWQTTGERFIDPTTGKLTEVTFDPATGQRSYVAVDKTE
jgi:hypothetical protein